MADIDAPNPSADPERPDAPRAAEAAVDAFDENVVDTAVSSVEDLLRDIGNACGSSASIDAGGESPKANDWFARAVDQLASGEAADLSPPPPDPVVAEDAVVSEEAPVPPPDRLIPDAPVDPVDDDASSSIDDVPASATDSQPDDVEITPAPTTAEEILPESEDDPFLGATFVGASLDETDPADEHETASTVDEASPSASVDELPTPEPPHDDTVPDTMPEPVPAESAEAAPFGDDDLRELDGALAGDVEELLQGNFDTVSAVLDDPPDEGQPTPAAPVEEQPEETPAVVESGSIPLPPRSPDDQVYVPETVSELHDPDEPEQVGEPLPDRAAPVATEPASEPEPEPESEPTAAAIETPPVEASPTAEAPPPVDASGTRAAILIEALAIISFPLRLVPTPLRPVVDWVALSLVFWVPIVWVIALFMVGQQ